MDSGVAAFGVEQQPAWEAAYRGGNTNSAVPSNPRRGFTRTAGTAPAAGVPAVRSAASHCHHLQQNVSAHV